MTTMMLEELATITFPVEMNMRELQGMFGFFARTGDLRIDYSVRESRTVQDHAHDLERIRDIGIEGSIYKPSPQSATSHFTCQARTTGVFTGIKFDYLPWKRIEEIPAYEKRLWEQIKEYVANYFDLKDQYDF